MTTHASRSSLTYFQTSLALAVSGVGSALSQVAVYSTLQSWNMAPSAFAAAFAAYILPGMFASQVAVQIAARVRISRSLGLFQLIGIIGCLSAVLGLKFRLPLVLIGSEFFSALSAGMVFPIINAAAKSAFPAEKAATVARWEGLMFGFQVIVGTLIGTLLYSHLGANTYFFLDGLTYILASSVVILGLSSSTLDTCLPDSKTVKNKIYGVSLSRQELSALLRLPLLALVATFGMATLPSYVGRWTTHIPTGMQPSTLILMSRAFGQFLAPLLIPEKIIHWVAARPMRPYGLLVSFVVLYILAARTQHAGVGCLAVLVAHFLSNIVFVVGLFDLQRTFSKERIAQATGTAYQWYTATAFASSVLASLAPATWPPALVITAGLVPSCLIGLVTQLIKKGVLNSRQREEQC